jgi:hypothetical protein
MSNRITFSTTISDNLTSSFTGGFTETTTAGVDVNKVVNQAKKSATVAYGQLVSVLDKSLGVVNNNKILSATLGMILILYSAKAAPELPRAFNRLFNNPIFKIVFMFLLAYITSKDPSVALVTAIVLYLSIQALTYYESSVAAKCHKKKLNELSDNIKKYIPTEVQLSEKQAEILSLLLTESQKKKDELNKVEQFGNTDLINKYRIEAFTADAVVDATVNTIQNNVAVEEALKHGDVEAANALNEVASVSKDQLNQLLTSQLSPSVSSELLSTLDKPMFNEVGTLPATPDSEPSMMSKIANALGMSQTSVSNVSNQVNVGDNKSVATNESVPTAMDNGLMASVDNSNMLLENCMPKIQQVDMCSLEKSNIAAYDNDTLAPVQ